MAGGGWMREVKPGVWKVTVSLGPDTRRPGRYREKTQIVHGGKRAAQKALAALVLERQAAQGTVGAMLDRWVAHLEVAGRSPSTVRRAEEIVRLHLKPALGGLELGELSPRDLEKLYAAKLAAKAAPRTVRHIHTVLGTALAWAVRREMVERNVARLTARKGAYRG